MKAGWEVKALGDVCEIYQPKTISAKQMTPDGKYVVFGANGPIGRYSEYNHAEPQLLITCRGATCGAVNKSEPFSWITGNAMVVRPRSGDLEIKYVEYFFCGAVDLEGVITGAAQPQITRQSLTPVKIPLPPLDEQKRIVAVLDAAFEGLTRARTHVETNLQNARELFAALLLGFQNQGDDVWSESRLEQLVTKDCTLSYGIVQPGDEVCEGLPIVRPTDLGEREIHLDGLKRIDPERSSGYARTVLQGGELLLCVRGTTGTIGIAAPELNGANVTRGIVPIRFDPIQLLQRFGYYAFISSPVKKQIEAATYGAALQQINIRDVRKIMFAYPKIEVQKKILDALDEAYDQAETLQADYRAKLQDLDDLRQSLLQKAFAGELT